jgi:hypothetical protein
MSDILLNTLLPDTADGERLLLAKMRGIPIAGTALASAARTASTLSANFPTKGARGIIVYLNVTAASGTGGLTLRPFGVDPQTMAVATSGTTTGVITTVGLRVFHFGPGCGAANAGSSAWGSVGIMLGRLMALQVLHADASSYTYSLNYELIP